MRFNGLLNQRLDSLLFFVHDFRGVTNFVSPFEPPLISQSNCRYDLVNLSRCPCSPGLQPVVEPVPFCRYSRFEIVSTPWKKIEKNVFSCVFVSFHLIGSLDFVLKNFFVGLDLRYNFGFADFNVAHMSSF